MDRENWDYEIELVDLQATDRFGNFLRNKKAAVDTRTGEILGVVSSSYQLIQNKTIYEVMKGVGEKIDLTLNSISVVKNKSGTIFRYGFSEKINKVIEDSLEPNDVVRFGIEVINSFDSSLGSSRFQAYAERLICFNGTTLPNSVGRFYFNENFCFHNFDI